MTIQLLYAHIDGIDVMEFDTENHQLIASDGEASTAILIGPVGLMDLGRDLIKIGMQLASKAEVTK
jgi:hypothetical protein